MSQRLCYGLVRVVVPSWGNGISVDIVHASKMQHGSHPGPEAR